MVISQINCYYTVSWTLVIYSITNVQSYNEATCSRGTRQVDCKCNKIVLSHYLAKWFLLFRMCDLIALTQRCKLLSFLHLIFAVLLANLKTDVISSSFEDMFDRMSEILGVTWPRPRDFWGKLFLRPLGFPKTKLRAEFEICCWNSFDDMLDRLPEILMITWPRPHHFCGNFFATLGFPKMKLRTKFEVSTSSWSSFEDMFDRMPKMWGVTWPRPRPFWGNLFVRPLGFAKAKRNTKFEVSSRVVLKICSIVCQMFEGSRDLGHAHFGETYLCARSAFPRRSYVPNSMSVAEVVLKIYSIVCQRF